VGRSWFFEKESHLVAQASLELAVLLLQPPVYYRLTSAHGCINIFTLVLGTVGTNLIVFQSYKVGGVALLIRGKKKKK
jgi:heme/copper-type cytochrome/quinol oxidase subunit 1